MPAGHTQGGMPAVAVPYFLVPSPLIAGAVPASRAEGAAGGLSFSVPTVLSPARIVMASGAFGVAEKMNNGEHHVYRATGSTLSPQGVRKESPRLLQTQVSANEYFFTLKLFWLL